MRKSSYTEEQRPASGRRSYAVATASATRWAIDKIDALPVGELAWTLLCRNAKRFSLRETAIWTSAQLQFCHRSTWTKHEASCRSTGLQRRRSAAEQSAMSPKFGWRSTMA